MPPGGSPSTTDGTSWAWCFRAVAMNASVCAAGALGSSSMVAAPVVTYQNGESSRSAPTRSGSSGRDSSRVQYGAHASILEVVVRG